MPRPVTPNVLLHCSAWNLLFLPSGNPSRAGNCGNGFPDELVYDAETNPNGIRCAHPEHNINLLGSRIDTDGVTRALQPLDNVGVQYGLRALQNGTMTVERFVDLNANIGYFNIDQERIAGPQRREATQEGLENAYRSGMVTDGRYLANVPIIDVRYNEPGLDIHLNWRALSVRERLEQANGHADNQVIWGYNQNQVPTSTVSNEAFVTMDAWLAAMEADTSSATLADRVLANKPSLATDRCLARVTEDGVADVRDVGLFTPECAVQFGDSPRIVAGGPVAEDVLKCQLKPLDFSSDDYRLAETGELISFTDEHQAQLRNVFSSGVCDWSRPGVAQQLNPGWMSFANGPGGEPLDLTWFERP